MIQRLVGNDGRHMGQAVEGLDDVGAVVLGHHRQQRFSGCVVVNIGYRAIFDAQLVHGVKIPAQLVRKSFAAQQKCVLMEHPDHIGAVQLAAEFRRDLPDTVAAQQPLRAECDTGGNAVGIIPGQHFGRRSGRKQMPAMHKAQPVKIRILIGGQEHHLMPQPVQGMQQCDDRRKLKEPLGGDKCDLHRNTPVIKDSFCRCSPAFSAFSAPCASISPVPFSTRGSSSWSTSGWIRCFRFSSVRRFCCRGD